MINLYTAVILLTLLLLVITAADIATNRLITKQVKKSGVAGCVVIGLAAAAECAAEMVSGNGDLAELCVAFKFIEMCLAPATGVIIAVAYGEPIKCRAAMAIVIIHVIFQAASLPQGLVVSVDSDGIMHREALFVVYVIVFTASIMYAFTSVILLGRKYQRNPGFVLACILLILAEGVVDLFADPEVRVAYICIAATNVFLYMNYFMTMLGVDQVTKLLDRRSYDSWIDNAPVGAVVVLFDVDDFKKVNDTYGHYPGDYCLQQIGACIIKVYKKCGKCFRIGGDEFCVIISSSKNSVIELNQQFVEELSAIRAEDERIPHVSMGYAFYDYGIPNISSVVAKADRMLYENKAKKKEADASR